MRARADLKNLVLIVLSAFLLTGCAVSKRHVRAAKGTGERMVYNVPFETVYEAVLRQYGSPENDKSKEEKAIFVFIPGPHLYLGFHFEPLGPNRTELEVLAAGWGFGKRDERAYAYNVLQNIGKRLKGTGPEAAPRVASSKAGGAVVMEPAVAPSDVDLEAPRKKKRPDDFALIVGIGKYRSLPDADFAERDAATVRKHLMGLGVPKSNIVHLASERASRTDLTKYLEEWLPKAVRPGSRVYFYYSGHGAPDPGDSSPYLVPYDGDPSFLKSTAYPVEKLYKTLSSLKVKEVVAIIDACYSGAGGRSVIAKGTRPLVTVVSPRLKGSKLSVLSAASDSEVAGSLATQGHGMFTYYVLKGLLGDADRDKDRHLTLEELHGFVAERVKVAAREQNREQTPQIKTTMRGLKIY